MKKTATLSFKFLASIVILFIVAIGVATLVQSRNLKKANEFSLQEKGNNLSQLLASAAVRPILTL